ncbi:hypothetical protein C8039_12165 [Halogeometricum sp. wsp3]|nr:hypothetical protein C8039_12165 [Halogeometricum sp. wsp3]
MDVRHRSIAQVCRRSGSDDRVRARREVVGHCAEANAVDDVSNECQHCAHIHEESDADDAASDSSEETADGAADAADGVGLTREVRCQRGEQQRPREHPAAEEDEEADRTSGT